MADLDLRPATWRGWRAAREATRATSVAELVAAWWHRAALLAVLACAAALNCVALDREGYANTYYAAGVKSMLASWRNFYFASFDAGGFVTIDKPPLGLWVQAISAKLFGFSGLSLLLPQALAGVLAVGLLYHLIARTFGVVAGLVAALALALTPIAVVTNRNNTQDTLLILVLLLAVWAALRAAESGRLRPLLLCAALIGLGFNIKMLQAYLVLPACFLPYLLRAPLRPRTRAWHLALAGLVTLAVSLSWAISVDLTPPTARPWIGSSGDNSVLSLILGYNGLNRLLKPLATTFPNLPLLNRSLTLDVAPVASPGIGTPGPLRLFNQGLAGEISWLLPLAIVGLLLCTLQSLDWRRPFRRPTNPVQLAQQQALLLWGGWLHVVGGFFSVARFFHHYYLIMLAPGIAALVGIAVAALWQAYRRGGPRVALLPLALIGTAIVQAGILGDFPQWSGRLATIVLGGTVAAAIVLVAGQRWRPLAWGALAVGLAALLVAPTVWSVISIQEGQGGAWLPQAGPRTGFGGGGPQGFGPTGGFGQPNGNVGQPNGRSNQNGGPFGGGAQPGGRTQGGGQTGGGGGQARGTQPNGGFGQGGAVPGNNGGGQPRGGGGAMTFAGDPWQSLDRGMVNYLLAHQGTTRYLVATSSSSYASLFILATDQPALALGGYQGWDRIVTPTSLASLVAADEIRFFYLGNSGDAQDATRDLTAWVQTNCTDLPSSTWQTATTPANGPTGFGGARGGQQQLYDCAARVRGMAP